MKKKGNERMPTPKQKLIHSPIPQCQSHTSEQSILHQYQDGRKRNCWVEDVHDIQDEAVTGS